MTTNEQSVAITTRRPNIVIVDDDDQIRHLLCAILDASGYKVRPASDGVVAMDILSKSLTSCNPIFICPECQI